MVPELSSPRVAALYRKYGGTIYSRCRRLLQDDAAAQDATQEVFIRVMRHIASAPNDTEALAWIYRISTNFCLNHLRDRQRRGEASDAVPEEAIPDPSEAIIDRRVAKQLLAKTPEPLRTPAFLYYIKGMEQAQVAEVLGLSRRTIIYRLAEFLQLSRARLGLS